MPSGETNSTNFRFTCCANLVVGLVLAIAQPVFAADSAVKQPSDAAENALTDAANLLKLDEAASDRTTRDRASARAQAVLEALIEHPPLDFETSFARAMLGKVHMQAGRAAMSDARTAAAPAEREALTKHARERFHAADPWFKRAADDIVATFGFHHHLLSPDDPRVLLRERRKGTLIQCAIGRAEVLEEVAATYPLDSAESRKYYEQAADRYASVYKDYRTLIAGVAARLKEGECLYRLGHAARAQDRYDELVRWPDDNLKSLRPWRVRAMALRLQCRNSDHEKAYLRAFSEGEEYLTHLPREEASWTDWRKVRYETARAYLAAAATLRADGTAPPERAAWLARADAHAARLTEESAAESSGSAGASSLDFGFPDAGSLRAAAETLRREIAKIGAVGGNGRK